MLDLKTSVEQDFTDNWVTTPLWIYGYNLDVTNEAEYIKLSVTPLDDTVQDTAATSKRVELSVEIICYAESLFRATQLSDLVIAQMRAATSYNIRTSITYDANELGDRVWFQRLTATAFRYENVI